MVLFLVTPAIIIILGFTPPPQDVYILLAWNDLGMHCANKDFSNMAVLPPYNNVNAQVIKKGSSSGMPKVVTTGMKVTYEIPGNTYSVGKTNFWTYAQQLFGVTLAANIGLKGAGLSGDMHKNSTNFYIEGIPITPYTDANLTTESPYQLGLFKLYDTTNTLLTSTQAVIPVSNEISCNACHSSEADILDEHTTDGGFNPANTPILCAKCHSSNALGTTGHTGVPSLSKAIHGKHGGITNDCYKCHPGPNTHCFRDVMFSKGLTCQTCHGSVSNVASTISAGRKPWLEEPKCGATACHGANYAEEPGKLFRQSKGHGGLYCSACHGSPHAIQPTVQPNDNVQNTNLQGFAGQLKKCSVCHGITPNIAGPHGYLPTDIKELESDLAKTNTLGFIYPNPFEIIANIPFSIRNTSHVHLDILDLNGRCLLNLINESLHAGNYSVVLNSTQLKTGSYFCRLSIDNDIQLQKIVVLK